MSDANRTSANFLQYKSYYSPLLLSVILVMRLELRFPFKKKKKSTIQGMMNFRKYVNSQLVMKICWYPKKKRKKSDED